MKKFYFDDFSFSTCESFGLFFIVYEGREELEWISNRWWRWNSIFSTLSSWNGLKRKKEKFFFVDSIEKKKFSGGGEENFLGEIFGWKFQNWEI